MIREICFEKKQDLRDKKIKSSIKFGIILKKNISIQIGNLKNEGNSRKKWILKKRIKL